MDYEDDDCACGQPGEFRACPFLVDVHGIDEMENICDDCYEDRCDAI
tara:strand:- start:7713 stop:7853 length:141 start_codon:yes stop_codon:yes gene_type:complete